MRKSKLSRAPNGDIKTKYFSLKGGLNLVDAPITMPPGMCLVTTNYELLQRDGYKRVGGFERHDGQESPTLATYWILNYNTNLGVTIPDDSQVLGATSGATGYVMTNVETDPPLLFIITDPETGLPLIDPATGLQIIDPAIYRYGYLVLSNVTGTFIDDEPIIISKTEIVEWLDGEVMEWDIYDNVDWT